MCAKLLHSCLTLWNPMDTSPPGSSVHGSLQARILEWVAMPFSRGSSWPRDRTCDSSLAGEFFTTEPPGKPKLLNRNSNFQFEVLEGIQGYRTQNVAWDKKTYTLLYPKRRMRKDGYWMALCWAREQMECRRMSVEMVWERKWLRTCCRSMRPHQGFS